MTTIPSVLITGASTGIGATYAERFARRGHDLVLVARDMARMVALGARLRQENGVAIDIIQADLTQPAELATVETRLRDDDRIGILVNNAGTAIGGSFIEQSTDVVTRPTSSVATKQKSCSPVGIATAVDAAENSPNDTPGSPVVYMWCTHRPKLRKPVPTADSTMNP